MKIQKYKKMTNGRYKVTLDDFDLILYEEVILKYNLLIKKDIDKKLIDEINKDNQYYEVYYSGLNSIKSRFRSVYELRELLRRKEYPIELVDSVIDKLSSQGYLNDESFTKAYINNQLIVSNKGPNKIKQELINHKIDINIIDKELDIFTEEEMLEKIEKLANRFYKSNRTRGGMVLKRKIMTDLINYGYDGYLIDKVLNKYDFNNNDDVAKKEYDKLYKKLSRKYSGDELKRKIKEKMYMKGLKYEGMD